MKLRITDGASRLQKIRHIDHFIVTNGDDSLWSSERTALVLRLVSANPPLQLKWTISTCVYKVGWLIFNIATSSDGLCHLVNPTIVGQLFATLYQDRIVQEGENRIV